MTSQLQAIAAAGGYHSLALAVPLPASAWMALPLLGVMTVIGKMRRRRCA